MPRCRGGAAIAPVGRDEFTVLAHVHVDGERAEHRLRAGDREHRVLALGHAGGVRRDGDHRYDHVVVENDDRDFGARQVGSCDVGESRLDHAQGQLEILGVFLQRVIDRRHSDGLLGGVATVIGQGLLRPLEITGDEVEVDPGLRPASEGHEVVPERRRAIFGPHSHGGQKRLDHQMIGFRLHRQRDRPALFQYLESSRGLDVHRHGPVVVVDLDDCAVGMVGRYRQVACSEPGDLFQNQAEDLDGLHVAVVNGKERKGPRGLPDRPSAVIDAGSSGMTGYLGVTLRAEVEVPGERDSKGLQVPRDGVCRGPAGRRPGGPAREEMPARGRQAQHSPVSPRNRCPSPGRCRSRLPRSPTAPRRAVASASAPAAAGAIERRRDRTERRIPNPTLLVFPNNAAEAGRNPDTLAGEPPTERRASRSSGRAADAPPGGGSRGMTNTRGAGIRTRTT